MMPSPDFDQLPFLIRLADDSSPRVRERVATQLRAFGSRLESEIRAQSIVLSRSQRTALDALQIEDEMSRSWLGWLSQSDENAKLEAALSHLTQWQIESESASSGETQLSTQLNLLSRRRPSKHDKPQLGEVLDRLALEFRATGRPWHPEALSAWLFVERGLRGDTRDYYNARNSNLLHVIESKRGIPISLSCVFILVGARLGLDIRGCNFPGHFLAHARSGGLDLLFDCFDAGRLLSPFETNAIRKAEPKLLSTRMPSEVIVARVLRNLTVSYEHTGEFDKVKSIQSMLGELEQATGL